MSMTPNEAEYEEFMDRLYEEHREQAIDEFTAELLQSYYRSNLLLAKPAFDTLIEARNLMKTSITAAFVFSAIAMEVALKETLLKPIVHGLVHAGSVASLVTDLVMGHRSMDRYKDLLLQVLREHGGVRGLHRFRRILWRHLRPADGAGFGRCLIWFPSFAKTRHVLPGRDRKAECDQTETGGRARKAAATPAAKRAGNCAAEEVC